MDLSTSKMSTVSLVCKGTFARGRKRISFSGVLGRGNSDVDGNGGNDED
ncbi:4150_t:CDS:2 [Gigaspora margarita]|uniref:4150_t:CDS:1 n=1 Tax=Gigaspora margarita TaxID=4874 RepID=A0ABN7UX98_GIGMA|nr:4150_t:CDS:2 [Gigaspora margarita]